MEQERYMLLPVYDDSCAEIILSKITDIRIKVVPMEQMNFTPNPKEIHLYGENNGNTIAFETLGLSVKKGLDVFSAVKWYARQQLNNPQMPIFCAD